MKRKVEHWDTVRWRKENIIFYYWNWGGDVVNGHLLVSDGTAVCIRGSTHFVFVFVFTNSHLLLDVMVRTVLQRPFYVW